MNQGDRDDFITEPDLDETEAMIAQNDADRAEADFEECLEQKKEEFLNEYVGIYGGITPPYFFHEVGELWIIAYEGKKPIHLPSSKGLKYLFHLLRNPWVGISVQHLSFAVEGTILSTDSVNNYDSTDLIVKATEEINFRSDKRTYRACVEKLNEYNEELKNPHLEVEGKETLKEKVEEISKYIKANFDKKGNPRSESSSAKNKLDSVRKAILKTLEKIKAQDKNLETHLKRYLDFGYLMTYKPIESIHWEFSFPKNKKATSKVALATPFVAVPL